MYDGSNKIIFFFISSSQESKLLVEHSNKISKDRGKSLKRWSDRITPDSGLPLLTAEQYAIHRAG